MNNHGNRNAPRFTSLYTKKRTKSRHKTIEANKVARHEEKLTRLRASAGAL